MKRISSCLSMGLALLVGLAGPATVFAANHREAPITALDHKADIADFFAFVSYDDPTKVTFILDVDPLLEPSNGPNYFPFDPEILYTIKIDNDFDAVRDVAFEFRFKTEIRNPILPYSFLGNGAGINTPANSPAPVPPGTPIIPPAITALDGPGSEGLSLRQTYSVTLLRGGEVGATRTLLSEGQNLYAVPSNVGPRTMPDYPALADSGIYDLGSGVRVFAGTVEDPFWIDLGAAFDSLNFRPESSGLFIGGVLDETQDANDTTNFAPDDVAGFNVNAIAIEVPITMINQDGESHAADDPLATIGSWGTTSRPKVKILPFRPGNPPILSNNFVQIQRMGNPLFNELIIGTGSKDKFSMSQPKNDVDFVAFALDPVLARLINADHTGFWHIPGVPRNDLLPLVQYVPPVAAAGTPTGPVADLLRLNTGIPPTAANQRSRLGWLTMIDNDPNNDDPAGYPNGRRVSDDVTDIVTRVVTGILAGPQFQGFPHSTAGDGVNTNDAAYRETFPYLGYAHSGVESRHVDPGEVGCTGLCP